MIAFIGRILFGAFFIFTGYNHLKNKKGTIEYAKSKKVWKAKLMVPLTGVLLVISGVFIIFGIPFAWFSKAFLIPFLIGVNIIMHDFWNQKGEDKRREMLSFMYNLALLGAILKMF